MHEMWFHRVCSIYRLVEGFLHTEAINNTYNYDDSWIVIRAIVYDKIRIIGVIYLFDYDSPFR